MEILRIYHIFILVNKSNTELLHTIEAHLTLAALWAGEGVFDPRPHLLTCTQQKTVIYCLLPVCLSVHCLHSPKTESALLLRGWFKRLQGWFRGWFKGVILSSAISKQATEIRQGTRMSTWEKIETFNFSARVSGVKCLDMAADIRSDSRTWFLASVTRVGRHAGRTWT